MSVSAVDYIPGGQMLQLSCSSLCPLAPGWCEEDYRKGTNQYPMNKSMKYYCWAFCRETGSSFCDQSIGFHFICLVTRYVWVAYPVSGAVWGTETNVVLPTQSLYSRERQAADE